MQRDSAEKTVGARKKSKKISAKAQRNEQSWPNETGNTVFPCKGILQRRLWGRGKNPRKSLQRPASGAAAEAREKGKIVFDKLERQWHHRVQRAWAHMLHAICVLMRFGAKPRVVFFSIWSQLVWKNTCV